MVLDNDLEQSVSIEQSAAAALASVTSQSSPDSEDSGFAGSAHSGSSEPGQPVVGLKTNEEHATSSIIKSKPTGAASNEQIIICLTAIYLFAKVRHPDTDSDCCANFDPELATSVMYCIMNELLEWMYWARVFQYRTVPTYEYCINIVYVRILYRQIKELSCFV